MERKIKNFDSNEIEKYKFHQHKNPFLIDIIDINKLVVSNKVAFGKKDFKYLVGYKGAKKTRPLYIYFFQKGVHIEEILIKLNV